MSQVWHCCFEPPPALEILRPAQPPMCHENFPPQLKRLGCRVFRVRVGYLIFMAASGPSIMPSLHVARRTSPLPTPWEALDIDSRETGIRNIWIVCRYEWDCIELLGVCSCRFHTNNAYCQQKNLLSSFAIEKHLYATIESC